MTPQAFPKHRYGEPIAAAGHMPFPGHRSMAEIWKAQASARKRAARYYATAKEFGFDPECVAAIER